MALFFCQIFHMRWYELAAMNGKLGKAEKFSICITIIAFSSIFRQNQIWQEKNGIRNLLVKNLPNLRF